MAKFRKGDRVYHGDRRHAKATAVVIPAACDCAQSLTLDASKHDTFDITTLASCCGVQLTLAITGGYEGQRILVRYVSGDACDSVAAVTVDGVAATSIGDDALSAGSDNENIVEVIVFDSVISLYKVNGE
jgi:azurin